VDAFFLSTKHAIVVSATIQVSSSHSESGDIVVCHGLFVLMPPSPHCLTRQLPRFGHVCNGGSAQQVGKHDRPVEAALSIGQIGTALGGTT